MKNQLINYTLYNLWANTKVCDEFLSKVDESLLDQEMTSSFPSIRKTTYHIWDAEFIWLNRLVGGNVTVLPIRHEPMFFPVFKEKFLSVSRHFVEFVSSKEDSYFTQNLTYKNSEGKEFTNAINDIIHHVMNHSTYHRGQIITLLREAGFTQVSSTDYITWCRLR